VFRLNDSNGAFSPTVGSPFAAGNSPGPLVVHPNNHFVYVANQTDNTISLFQIDQHVGALVEVLPRVNTGDAPSSMVIDKGGGFLFVANQISSNISTYTIDAGSGALKEVAGSPFPAFRNPTGLALTPSGKFLYVVNTNLALVFGYAVNSGVLHLVRG